MIPEGVQIGTTDVATWRSVPAESNVDGDTDGAWAVVGGDGDEYDLYVEVVDAEAPKRVAEFIIESVKGHAHGLRCEAALSDVERERGRQRAEDPETDPSNLHLPDVTRLAGLIEEVGAIGRELHRHELGRDRTDLDKRLYEHLTQVAATTVAWMESILAREDDLPASIGSGPATG